MSPKNEAIALEKQVDLLEFELEKLNNQRRYAPIYENRSITHNWALFAFYLLQECRSRQKSREYEKCYVAGGNTPLQEVYSSRGVGGTEQ